MTSKHTMKETVTYNIPYFHSESKIKPAPKKKAKQGPSERDRQRKKKTAGRRFGLLLRLQSAKSFAMIEKNKQNDALCVRGEEYVKVCVDLR